MGQAIKAREAGNEGNMKRLRQGIMAAASKRGWNYEEMHAMMIQWGYGSSLRALSLPDLMELRRLVQPERPVDDVYDPGQLDDQGKYMWKCMKEAGWDWKRVRKFIIKHYKKTHWNCLDWQEKRAVISMLKKYGTQTKRKGEKDD